MLDVMHVMCKLSRGIPCSVERHPLFVSVERHPLFVSSNLYKRMSCIGVLPVVVDEVKYLSHFLACVAVMGFVVYVSHFGLCGGALSCLIH